MFGDLLWLTFITSLQIFEGNSQQKPQKKNILRPPVVTGAIRVHPQIFPEKQVCLRLELLGCSLKNGNWRSVTVLLSCTHLIFHLIHSVGSLLFSKCSDRASHQPMSQLTLPLNNQLWFLVFQIFAHKIIFCSPYPRSTIKINFPKYSTEFC